MTAPFSFTAKVAFGDVDSAGIMYYPRLFHYCHLGLEAFAEEALGRTYADLLDVGDRGFPTVRAEAEYLIPIPYGTILQIGVTVRHIGNSSLKLEMEFGEEGSDVVFAVAKLTKVCVAMKQFASVPLSDEFRGAFQRFYR